MKHLFLFFLLLLASCSLPKETQDKALFYYGKTACLSECPVYDLHIFNNGKVIYYGIDNVKIKGWQVSKISIEKLQKIKKELAQIQLTNNQKLIRSLPVTIIIYKDQKISTQDTSKISRIEQLLRDLIPS